MKDAYVVYRSIPTSNRNIVKVIYSRIEVVYRSIPTSNRNRRSGARIPFALYIVLFLHQTATCVLVSKLPDSLYIVLFLHQTATCNLPT